MATHQAIQRLTKLGLIKFPEPETRSVQAIKKDNMRSQGKEKPYNRKDSK